MRYFISVMGLALSLAPRGLAAQTVPASLDVAGLHLTLDEDARRLVGQKVASLTRHPASFQARVALAEAALPLVDQVLRQAGVPADFRYVPLQESALQADAQSNHGAVGYWQMKRETAQSLGLLVGDDVDERRHLAASTRAAARYLAGHNAALHNWLNALLAYNTGLGGVRPYTLPTDDGATQMTLTGQTHPYLLGFVAQKLAFEPAVGHSPVPPPVLREVPAAPGQRLSELAATLGADPAELADYNRWLLTDEVPAAADGHPFTVVVPLAAAQAGRLAADQQLAAAGLKNPALAALRGATVQINRLPALVALPGETKEDLARRGGVELSYFLKVNELSGLDAVVAGRPYFLEKKREAAEHDDYHVAQPGETLAAVAQQYGVQRRALEAKNRLGRDEALQPGRVLWLRHTRPRDVAAEYRPVTAGPRHPVLAAAERPAPVLAQAAPTAADDEADQTDPAAAQQEPEYRPNPKKRRRANHADVYRGRVARDRDVVEDFTEEKPRKPGKGRPAAPARRAAPEPVEEETAPPAAPEKPAGGASAAVMRPAAPLPGPAPLADEPAVSAPAPAVRETAAQPIASASVPAPSPGPAPAPAATPAVSAAAPAAAEPGLYTVQPRETLYALARRAGVTPADLAAWNNLAPTAGLQAGQRLRLSAPAVALAAPAAEAAPAKTLTHTVAAGETMFALARRYNCTVAQLQAWNGKPDPALQAGEVLRVQTAL